MEKMEKMEKVIVNISGDILSADKKAQFWSMGKYPMPNKGTEVVLECHTLKDYLRGLKVAKDFQPSDSLKLGTVRAEFCPVKAWAIRLYRAIQ